MMDHVICHPQLSTLTCNPPMLSARNQFRGTIKEIKLGNVMADVIVTVGAIEVVAAITRASAEKLALKPGDTVAAVIKSTDVLIDK